MALLTLKDVGKIYVSENNVAVGIRGVNLSFERGEFVAITGKSGSGKSTLLNVISGMDSYEEGELYIEGQSTSHYLQPDWEEYRAKYISFIFQDYNIIESFTVLQNVELALMHIENGKERRRRALELIERVGLSSHAKQKGSQLSGGQKQRTVIARALAKDSPIILADEPTGNLDSATSKEIIDLLHEVSKDKLLIVVTHNFEHVEAHATRHVRVFDGSVESDQTIAPSQTVLPKQTQEVPPVSAVRGTHVFDHREIIKTAKDGGTLGCAIFTAKPKLSVFLCLLMMLAALGVFFVTAFCGGFITDAFQPRYMFHPVDGRLVVSSRTGEVANEERVKTLANELGAIDYLRYDALVDREYTTLRFSNTGTSLEFAYTYDKTYGNDIFGRYPTAANEVFLYVHIGYEEDIGSIDLLLEQGNVEINFSGGQQTAFKVVGIKYFYDNNLSNQAVFTGEGFDVVTALYYFQAFYPTDVDVPVTITRLEGEEQINFSSGVSSVFEMEEGKVYFACEEYEKLLKEHPAENIKTYLILYAHSSNYSKPGVIVSTVVDPSCVTDVPPVTVLYDYGATLFVHPTLLVELMEQAFDGTYNQFSLFFENNAKASAAAETLGDMGYSAVLSNVELEKDAYSVIVNLLVALLFFGIWLTSVLFLAFFLNLCTRRALEAFKGDMAIMRSMGISVRVIKLGIRVRMLLSLIPAYLGVIVAAVVIYLNPASNVIFTYLYAWQYAAIFIGLLIITLRITHKQIGTLFSVSVKKSLKGGSEA